MPVTVIAFFALPIIVALFSGRAFCAGVCPQGALQDFFLLKPVKVPLWLEHGLGVIPYIFLGAGIAYAATGTGFVICRYDPFVPIFRLSGSFFIFSAGVSFLILGMFVGRPYCRFLCPVRRAAETRLVGFQMARSRHAGFLHPMQIMRKLLPLRRAARTVRRPAAPTGAWRTRPAGLAAGAAPRLGGRGRLGRIGPCPVAARLHPTVALAELYARQQQHPVVYGVMTPEALALARAEQDPEAVLAAAADLRGRFRLATMLFGGWFGLVLGVKLITLSLRQRRTDFEPDRGACFACARCFSYCPNERVRLGLPVPAELAAASAAPAK